MTEGDILADLALKLRIWNSQKSRGKAFIGFDGYIDRVVRLKKNQMDPPDYFDHIGDFSDYIRSNQDKSMDIGVRRINEKLGGNGPLMAESLAAKNIAVCCVGAFGYPQLHDAFRGLSQKCSLVSVEQTAFTFALEFNDAKIMLGETESLDRITWEKLAFVMGEDQIISRINESDIVGFTNWSGLSKSNDILRGMMQFVCPQLRGKKKILFFDLADPSCKSKAQFADFFDLVKELVSYFDISLGLNGKELVLVYNHFFNSREAHFNEAMTSRLAESLGINDVVVHGADWAAASDRDKNYICIKGIKIADPLILTGAGDNFNAGYCLGKLCSLELAACMYLGNISASLYVKNGAPAGIHEIITYIENILHFEGEHK